MIPIENNLEEMPIKGLLSFLLRHIKVRMALKIGKGNEIISDEKRHIL